mgnify:CR=1 FL=1
MATSTTGTRCSLNFSLRATRTPKWRSWAARLSGPGLTEFQGLCASRFWHGDPDRWWSLGADQRIDALAAWRIATTSLANKGRTTGRGVQPKLKAEDLRWMMASPASLSDVGELWMLANGPAKSGSRGKVASGQRQTINLGDIRPGQLASLIGARKHDG